MEKEEDNNQNMTNSHSLGNRDEDNVDGTGGEVNKDHGRSRKGWSLRKKRAEAIGDPDMYLDNPSNPCFIVTSSSRHILVISTQVINDYGLKFGDTIKFIDGFAELKAKIGNGKCCIVVYKWREIYKRNDAKPEDIIIWLGYVLDYVPHLLGFLSIADLLEFKFVPDFEGSLSGLWCSQVITESTTQCFSLRQLFSGSQKETFGMSNGQQAKTRRLASKMVGVSSSQTTLPWTDFLLFSYDGSRTFWVSIFRDGFPVKPKAHVNIQEISDEDNDETAGDDEDDDDDNEMGEEDNNQNMIISLSLGSSEEDDVDTTVGEVNKAHGSSRRVMSSQRKRAEAIGDPEMYLDDPSNPFFIAVLQVGVLCWDYDLKFDGTIKFIYGFGELEAKIVDRKDRFVVFKWKELYERNDAMPEDVIICEILREGGVVRSIKAHFLKK
ncbi:hypothetical protein Bca101_011050 [Brassica carinata]